MNTVELAVADTSITSLPAMANLASVLGNYPEGENMACRKSFEYGFILFGK